MALGTQCTPRYLALDDSCGCDLSRTTIKAWTPQDIEDLQFKEVGLDKLLLQQKELKITAALDGVIESLELEPGDLAAAGAPVMSMLDSGELWVRAYLPERLHLELGQKVSVTVDAFPDAFDAEVTFISRQAEFTPSNVQTPEERSKQVFRLKVALRTGLDRLRPGMAGDVHFESPKDEK